MPKLFRPKLLVHLTLDINDVEETSTSSTTLTWKIKNPTGQVLSENARIVLDNLYIKKLDTTDIVYLYTNSFDTSLSFDSRNKSIYGAVLFNTSSDAVIVNYVNHNPEISKNWKVAEKFLAGNQSFKIDLFNCVKSDIEQLYFTLIIYDDELELQQDTGPWSSDQLISNKQPNQTHFLK